MPFLSIFSDILMLFTYNKPNSQKGFCMYLIISIFFGLCILLFIILFYRRKAAICKICCMNCCEKLELFDRLAEPFGYTYLPDQDIMTSRLEAWQRKFGYRFLYDRTASQFDMIFDCEPVYFNYEDRTWLIEFWKGQYGMSLGSEIGIYKADAVLPPDQYDKALFHSASDTELLPTSMEVNFKGRHLFSVHRLHWWLTGFRIGSYCEPEDLTVDICLTFPSENMLHRFAESLCRLGYQKLDLDMCRRTVSFTFADPHTRQPRCSKSLRLRISQRKNQLLCRLYGLITRPFTCTMDRILFLYFFLPFSLRHVLHFRKNRGQKPSKTFRKRREQKPPKARRRRGICK